uniref:Uncharacterized protein n=1 Tax=Panagrolaimus sp. JU765 TaxID=591449 RepID=A0AC34Q3H3_9BILA
MRYLHYFSIFYPPSFDTYDQKTQEYLTRNFETTCAEFVALKACIISLKDCVSKELFVNSIALYTNDGVHFYVNYRQMEYICGQGYNDGKDSVKCLDSANFTTCEHGVPQSCDSMNSHLKCITNQAKTQCGSSAKS